MKRTKVWFFALFALIVFAWPIVSYPLTDGDIENWTDSAVELSHTGNFFSGSNDQGHGPLMVWTGALSLKVFGYTPFALNFFNLLMGVLGVVLVYFFSNRIWKDDRIAQLSSFLYVTSVAPVYLSRTPMYDWPAAVLYTAFCGFYYLAYREKNKWFAVLAFLAIGIASLSRFSIALGLAGFFIMGVQWIEYRSIKRIVRDGILLVAVIGLINLPWFLGQMTHEGTHFLKTFLYDNTGRFVKSTRPKAKFNADFYGFPLYTLVGLLPFTFCAIGSFFRKGIVERFKKDSRYLVLLVGFLPCLVLFSMSGHTKLGRYISYVFPMLMMLLAAFMVQFDLSDESYRKRAGTLLKWTFGGLIVLLVQQTFQFFSQAQESLSFVVATVVLLLSLLVAAYDVVIRRHQILLNNAYSLLPSFGGIYLLYFSCLTFLMYRAPFLIHLRLMMENALKGLG